MIREKDVFDKQKAIEKKLDDIITALQHIYDIIEQDKPKVPKYVYGIKGLAQLLGCSTSTAKRLKRSGVLDGAIIQRNRSIIVDAQRALALFDDSDARYGYSRIRQRRK